MRTAFEFVLSLVALPILLPLYLSEKLFYTLFQPLIHRKYDIATQGRERSAKRLALYGAGGLILLYCLYIFGLHYQRAGSLQSALVHLPIYGYMLYNGIAVALNWLLQPVNTLLAFAQGANLAALQVLLAFYLCFAVLLVIANLGYGFYSTHQTLRGAVALRDAADKDINIVGYSRAARRDELFLGVDIQGNGKPFYVKKGWLRGHAHILGAPGSGKTESIIQPLWFQSVRRDIPTFVLDGKASSRNVDRFFTIASSLAQGQDIIYFNPNDPERSASYNPLQHGSPVELQRRLTAAIEASGDANADSGRIAEILQTIIAAIQATTGPCTLLEILKYLESKTYVGNQLDFIRDVSLRDRLCALLDDFTAFQNETAWLNTLLWEICQSEFGPLLETTSPEIDIAEIYQSHRDCYFTLPGTENETASKFLGRLILADIQSAFEQIAATSEQGNGHAARGDGLLIIDELERFVSPQFDQLLNASKLLGVSCCYTSHSFSELATQNGKDGNDAVLAIMKNTNMLCCFQLQNQKTIESVLNLYEAQKEDAGGLLSAKLIERLNVGECVVLAHHPRVLRVLKTGYFKFDKLIRFRPPKQAERVAA